MAIVDDPTMKTGTGRVTTTAAADEPRAAAAPAPQPGIALCLSGGGYRAMLFHAGTLWRLNELGYLPRLDLVSSVSGGSITAGALGIGWAGFAFDAAGVATNFVDQLIVPVKDMAATAVDVEAVLLGHLPGIDGAKLVTNAYRDHLFATHTLQDLPDRPRFVINATNMQSGVLWRFTKKYLRDWRVGEVADPQTQLAVAVTASSAFPPALAPVHLNLQDGAFAPGSGSDLQHPPYTTAVTLADGGIYDNMGLEPAWKRYDTILVSDAGKAVAPEPAPKTDPLGYTLRVLDIIQNQVHALRSRELIASYKAGERKGAYWGIGTAIAAYRVANPLPCPPEKTAPLATYPTRLKAVPEPIQERLINWGYAVCDAAMRAYVDPGLPAPAGFPYPGQGVG